MSARLVLVGGARPNFMKLAPLLRELGRDAFFQPVLVHTGQHYDQQMSGQFFVDLDMPAPDHYLEAGSGSHAAQTAQILSRMEPVLLAEKPDGVVVVGDVNSTIAAALAAKKLQIPLIHVEAGLRSFDRTMPEEINRLATDAITDLFLVTEESGRRNLLGEGADPGRIHLVGNLMIDSLRRHLDQARADLSLLRELGLDGAPYALLTLHRPANVDSGPVLDGILDALEQVGAEMPVLFPVHPRTRARLGALGRTLPGVRLLDPLGYLDFLRVMSAAQVVFTDSGGVQEETTALGIPCLTLRDNTERPVTVDQGTNRLAGTSRESILKAWNEHRASPRKGALPQYWDGTAAARCRAVLAEFYGRV